MTSHPRCVRQPWQPHGTADKRIAGLENGRDGLGKRRLRAGEHAGPGPFVPVRCNGCRRMRQVVRGPCIWRQRRPRWPASHARLCAKRRSAGRQETGPARPFAAPPDRDRHGTGKARRRVPLATEAINATTFGGRLIFHIFGAPGQFGRDLIQERTRPGLAAATTRGCKGGRKPAVIKDKLQQAREHTAKGLTVREAAIHEQAGKTVFYQAFVVEPV